MHVCGIIAEYNPLHSGHQYHMEETKKVTGADYIITVLSGDFVQRGLPAVLDKHTRARLALETGSDLVLELPVSYALSSGEGFGFGGVSLLNQLGCVDSLSFGTEEGALKKLLPIAKILVAEDTIFAPAAFHITQSAYQSAYQAALKQGLSHPAARLEALKAAYPKLDTSPLDSSNGQSNNMLALEYCKALYRLHSNIEPVTVKRRGQGYLDREHPNKYPLSQEALDAENTHCDYLNREHSPIYTTCFDNMHFASATAIRNIFESMQNQGASDISARTSMTCDSTASLQPLLASSLQNAIPEHTLYALQTASRENALLFPDDFSALLHYKLLTLTPESLCQYREVTKELANKIYNKLSEYTTFTQFANLLWSKDLTYARVCRCLMHILLDIKEDNWDVHRSVPYARVLGFRKEAAPLLSAIKQHSSIPLITKLADAENILNAQTTPINFYKPFDLLKKDIQAAHIYDSVRFHKSGKTIVHEARKQIMIL